MFLRPNLFSSPRPASHPVAALSPSLSESYQVTRPSASRVTLLDPELPAGYPSPPPSEVPSFAKNLKSSASSGAPQGEEGAGGGGCFSGFSSLDEENLHFSLSEAVLVSVEEMFSGRYQDCEDEGEELALEDDEVIQDMKSRLSLYKRMPLLSITTANPLLPDLTPTSETPLPLASPAGTPPPSDSPFPAGPRQTWESLSFQFPASSTDILAQAVLKRAVLSHVLASLEWMVDRTEAPQNLLPLPPRLLSEIVSTRPAPSSCAPVHLNPGSTRLRGNYQWAPPRPQILFSLHPAPPLEQAMVQQSFLCAGCGMHIERSFYKNLNLCYYYNKYFCQTCMAPRPVNVPAYILNAWDFKKYSVSGIAYNLINKISNDPLFSVMVINQGLYKRVKALHKVYIKRFQLCHLFTYIRSCKFASKFVALFNGHTHWATDIHLYSLSDLNQVREATLMPLLDKLSLDLRSHIIHCFSCRGKGFICEYCKHQEPIFPFDLYTVTRCKMCKACYHSRCYNPNKCPKCIRQSHRSSRSSALT